MLAQLWSDWNSVDAARLMVVLFVFNFIRPIVIICGLVCGIVFQRDAAVKVAGACGALLVAADWYLGNLPNHLFASIIHAWACIMAPIAWCALTLSIIEWRRKRAAE
jgi:hypothetical protein